VKKKPEGFRPVKSLEALVDFINGYMSRATSKMAAEKWEELTGLNYFEHYEEASQSGIVHSEPPRDYFLTGFDKYVHAYYDCEIVALKGTGLILLQTSSD